MATYNVHAGHCPQGQGASGAVGLLKESVEDRKVKNRVISALRGAGHTVYDCTDDTNCAVNQNLQRIVAKCNAHSVNLDVSIHLNSGRNDYAGDGSTGGVEVWCYNEKTKAIAERICANISAALGIRNRGVKYSKGLYVLKHTKAPALLVECCFVDDKDDANHWNADKCGDAIASGITGKKIQSPASNTGWIKDNTGWWYKHKDGSYTKSDWEKIGGAWYYFDTKGYMKTGWLQDKGKWYFLSSTGAMVTGVQTIGKETFYFAADGHMCKTNDRGALI